MDAPFIPHAGAFILAGGSVAVLALICAAAAGILSMGYEIAEHYQPPVMPSTFVVDERGDILYRHGGSSEESWRRFVDFMETVEGRRLEQD